MTTEREERAVEAALERVSEDGEEPTEVDLHDDRTKETRTPGFSRMRVDWHSHDAGMLTAIIQAADDRVAVAFTDAYKIINDIYGIVREHKASTKTGEFLYDRHGFPVWETTESGRFIEDYSRLGIKERQEFLFQITTRLFDWEQRSAEAWGEAMFAKAQWEERFSTMFLDTSHGGRKTDEAMTQRGRYESREERYFAIFESLYSRKCEALVRSMERLSLRLSQTSV